MPATSSQERPHKKHRKGQDSADNDSLLRVIQDTNEFIAARSTCHEPDEDGLFGQSLGK